MSRRRRVLVVAVVLAALVVGSAAVAVERVLTPPGSGEVRTFLLLGSDEGPMRSANPLRGRADGIQLLFVSGNRKHATFVSIPRDAYVPVPGRGTTRINACLVSGPDNCVATVEREFGVDVDGYVLTSMHGFARAVNSFGGLTVDVPAPIFDGGHDVPRAGEQHLSGMQALTYARDRKNRPGGDFTRSGAQAELLALAHREVVRSGDVRRALDAIRAVRSHSVTDLSGQQIAHLGFEALRLPPKNVKRVVAPGQHSRAGSAAIVRLQPRAYEVIDDAARNGRLG
jgi:polyisoprenyl-teichoic acid--peptidoglycan teichoic acid transferase